MPLIADSRVVLILYGDNAPENHPIDSLTSLESMAEEVGQAMDGSVQKTGSQGPLIAELAQRQHDPLTGLPDREAVAEHVAKTLRRSAREEGAIFAVLVLDIERFKSINASLGWAAGNELLCAVGNRFSQRLRPTDVVSRLDRDLFCLVLDRIRTQRDAKKVAKRISDLLGRPLLVAGQEVTVKARIGIVLNHPDCTDGGEMIRQAEKAAQAAKSQHLSSIRLWKPPPGGDRLQTA